MRGTHHLVENVTLVTESCCTCSLYFAMPLDFKQQRLERRDTFYCPAGHAQHYTGKSEEQKLRDEVERKQQMLDAERARAQRIAGERDRISKAHRRMRTRVMNGVCPCCNRTFQNLMLHMKTEHQGELNLRTLREAFGMTQTAVAEEVGVQSAYISLHERGKPVPGYAVEAICTWIDRHVAKV